MPQNNTPITKLLNRKSSDVYSTSPDQSVFEAVAEMNRHRVGSLVVLEEQKLVGIFTERDVLTRVVAKTLDPQTTRIADVMTPDPQFLHTTDTIATAMQKMTEKRTRHLPVFDTVDCLVGLISIGDVTRWQMEEHQVEAEHLKNYVFGEYSA
ncbi:CBS domain-containing protein [Puniceicoccus vermicola]|uniref:CBS domain-containing protein n=1 Tax=Puniceicoccus vermicola TaxID=388746 RepID=A0A7X1AY40_9BACT|nr:CBS domain-containing protein [Puniceicoccus vermicola]MBC2602123.1 CBS domain-containing protein [Puniceicoccus vermicola]